jgi:Apea-like HEPN
VTRNYEIHLDPDHEDAAASGIGLVVLVYQLRTLVETILLLDLGFSDEEADGIFDRIRRYSQVEHLKREADKQKAELSA